jgi:hypothetical protein
MEEPRHVQRRGEGTQRWLAEGPQTFEWERRRHGSRQTDTNLWRQRQEKLEPGGIKTKEEMPSPYGWNMSEETRRE